MEIEIFDIAKLYPKLYLAEAKQVIAVDVPTLRILSISGEGDPKGKSFELAVDALYTAVYGIKFMPRKGINIENFQDFKVSALESLWSMKDGKAFDTTQKNQWQWDVCIVIPGFVTQLLLEQAITLVSDKKPNPNYPKIHIKTLEERHAVQILHTGSYANQEADIAMLHSYMISHDLKPTGRHHEIYLNDPKRVATARLKTIIRQPLVKS